jgi:Ca-activated chloride channel family protein
MKLLLIFLFYISTLGWVWGDSLASKNKEGNMLYKEGRVDEALSKWRDAQIENPDSDKLHYNIGSGLHQQKKYKDAVKEYEKSLDSKDSELQAKAYYNIGNTHYRMGKLPEAIEDYKRCLNINPKDEDAKYNIEFIKKKLKEQPKKEEQQQKESQKSEEARKKEEREAQSQEEKKGTAKEDKKEEQLLEEGKEKKAEETSNHESRTTNDEKEMSKEDAVRLLDAFKDDEKDIQKELKNQPAEGRYRVDKDW